MQILCPRAPSSRRVVPPAPDPAPDDLSLRQIVATIRSNHLRVWSKRAYHEDLVHSRTLGRTSLLLNRPDAIRHVLVDQHENYTRTPATLRILRPLLGQGLLTSAGPTWRHQRRTLAPAFSPKSVDLLVPHMLAPIREAVGELKSGASVVDLRQGQEPTSLGRVLCKVRNASAPCEPSSCRGWSASSPSAPVA
jgi:cytochrome P450